MLVQDGDPESAERYLTRAFYTNPDDRDVLLPLGFLLVSRGKAHLAVSMLSRAAALYPDDPDMARMLGIACRSLGWHQAAEVQFLRAWKLDPTGSGAPYNLAILYATLEQPRHEDAGKWYEIAIKNGGAQDPQLERFLKHQAVAVRNDQP
ncbi:MAG: tetratricopeptide repeat protein [Lentisphaeria bacterium]|jgi:Flp pilus assembly protein TadD|nr:tetratricopeptide repeat protein [Lentisphaeria bacterium]